MFVSFKSEEEAIRQAHKDSPLVRSMLALSEGNELTINPSVQFITDTYHVYLDTLVELLEAKYWKISDGHAKSVVLCWSESLQEAA